MLTRLLLLGIGLLMNTATATPTFTSEAELSNWSLSDFNAYWQDTAETGHFYSNDGLQLPYAKLFNSQYNKSIIVVNGRTESFLKYQELARDLFNNGYNVYLYDHRGQGLAPRLLDNPQMGHVTHFDDYVQDLEQFVQQVVLQNPVDSLYLLAHSMGGTISALWLSETQVRLQAAALASPMMSIHLKPLPRWLTNGLVSVLSVGCEWLGHTACYAPGQKDYQAVPFANNVLTHSETRYQQLMTLYQQQPELQLGGVSLRWLQEALKAGDLAIAKAGRITTPLLVLQADKDVVVDSKAQHDFCAGLAHCEGGAPQVIKHAAHELLVEQDQQRNQALTAILDFFAQYP